MFIQAGRYYADTFDGRRIDLGPTADGSPDIVICRRVADFPRATPPDGCGISACVQCDAPIAYNRVGPHRDRPRICMQCADIQPLPLEES